MGQKRSALLISLILCVRIIKSLDTSTENPGEGELGKLSVVSLGFIVRHSQPCVLRQMLGWFEPEVSRASLFFDVFMKFYQWIFPVSFLVPGKPVNISIGEVTDSTIALSWAQPEDPNGIIKGYRVYFMKKNFTNVQTVRSAEAVQKFVLTGLGTSSYLAASVGID